MENKIQYVVAQFCPFIIDKLGLESAMWQKVNSKLIRRVQAQNATRDKMGIEPIMRSLHDWVVGASLNDKMSIAFLSFIDSTAREIFNRIPPHLHPKLKNTLENLFTEFDQDITFKNNPSFLNYIAELACLNRFLTGTDYELLAIEQPIINGKHADFYLSNSKTLAPILIECLSIHIEPHKVGTSEGLKIFLVERFNRKLEGKTKGLPEKGNLVQISKNGILKEIEFALMPVLWYDHQDLLAHNSAFEELDANLLPFCCPCCTVIAVSDGENFHFEFRTVSSIYRYFKF